MCRLWNHLFRPTPVINTRLIVGNRKNPKMVKQLTGYRWNLQQTETIRIKREYLYIFYFSVNESYPFLRNFQVRKKQKLTPTNWTMQLRPIAQTTLQMPSEESFSQDEIMITVATTIMIFNMHQNKSHTICRVRQSFHIIHISWDIKQNSFKKL